MGSGRVVKVTGIKDKGPTATVLLRGSNQLVLDEADRSLHDALCVVRCLVQVGPSHTRPTPPVPRRSSCVNRIHTRNGLR